MIPKSGIEYGGIFIPYLWVVLFLACIFPMVFNGFPLVFHDTWNYISRWDNLSAAYPPFYSVFVWLTSRVASVYLVVIVQALLCLYVVRCFTVEFVPRNGEEAACLVAGGIVLLTQLPWLSNWLMPDFIAGLGGAALVTLLLSNPKPLTPRDVNLSVVVLLSALVSTGNLLVLVAFSATCILVRRVAGLPIWPRHLVYACLIPVIAVLLVFSANKVLYGRTTINIAGPALHFAKLVDAKIAQPYLHEKCRSQKLPICEFLPELDRINGWQGFLWDNQPQALADRTGAWSDKGGQISSLVREIIWARFPDVSKLALRDTANLFLSSVLDADGTGTGEFMPHPIGDNVHAVMQQLYPDVMYEYNTSRQQNSRLLEFPSRFYTFTTYVGYLLLLGSVLMLYYFEDILFFSVAVSSIVFLGLHIILHGVLVGAYARYHAKVSWIAWLVILVGAIRLTQTLVHLSRLNKQL